MLNKILNQLFAKLTHFEVNSITFEREHRKSMEYFWCKKLMSIMHMYNAKSIEEHIDY